MNDRAGFVESLLAAAPDGRAKLALISVLQRYAGTTIYIPAQSHSGRRKEQAAKMLGEQHMEPADVVQVLRTRFNICERTAQRDVDAARQLLRQMSERNGVTG